MIDTTVKLKIGTTLHHGWEKVEIRRSLYSLSGTFSLSLSPVWHKIPEDYAIYAGEDCQVLIGEKPVITGFIDRVKQSIESSNRTIQVEGRDKTADLVDCSYMGTIRVWQKIGLGEIASKLLSQFKIKHFIHADPIKMYPTWGIQEESIFDNLSHAASLRKMFLTTNGLGDVIFTKAEHNKVSATIGEKTKLLSAENSEDYSGRYSYYETRVQNFQAEKVSEAGLKVIGQATDPGVKRKRPLLIQQDGEIESGVAQSRVEWERDLRISRSRRLDITLPGWLNDGKLWDYNQIINVSLPKINAFGEYLITGLQFGLDSPGMKTTLECEGIHSADIDPTLELREYNVKRVVDEERQKNQ